MSLDIDERLEQKKLELYEKHGLDGSMSDEEVANKIRSLSSNKVRQQLLNDFLTWSLCLVSGCLTRRACLAN